MQTTATLDGFDRKILAALADDGGSTNLVLADRVGLSVSQCSRRRQRLEQLGVIRGYRVDIDPLALGLSVTAFVQVSLTTHTVRGRELFSHFLMTHPSVQSCHAVTGDADYILRVVVKDLPGLNEFVLSLLRSCDNAMLVRSLVALETVRDNTMAVPVE